MYVASKERKEIVGEVVAWGQKGSKSVCVFVCNRDRKKEKKRGY